MLLEMEGHEVRVAHLGRTALTLAQTFRPDTAVLDIGMPDLSGYEVAKSLQHEPWAENIQLIALTGWGQDADRKRALEAGFHHHLIKPVDGDRLMELVGR
jgi:DNA-binding response OmpR family regulator